jgi:hypothetical protein
MSSAASQIRFLTIEYLRKAVLGCSEGLRSVSQVEPGYDRVVCIFAIESGTSSVSGAGGRVQERLIAGHVSAHVIGPFQDLGSDVFHERFGLPPSQKHDFITGMIHEEEAHGRSGA